LTELLEHAVKYIPTLLSISKDETLKQLTSLAASSKGLLE